jgi:hypothetical protein
MRICVYATADRGGEAHVFVVELVLLDELGYGDDVLKAVPEQVGLLAKEPLAVVACTEQRKGT